MASEDPSSEGQPRLVTEIAELYPPQKEWTEADYFALPDTNRLIELSDGELIMPPHPTETHQRVLANVYDRFHSFNRAHDLGILRFAALPVRLWAGKIREPDILFVFHEHADRIGEEAWGPPDLVVEVISPSTRRSDREEKFVEYARAGIREYWLVDPEAHTIEVFVLEGRAYLLLVKAGRGGKARSQLLKGFELDVDQVFANQPLSSSG